MEETTNSTQTNTNPEPPRSTNAIHLLVETGLGWAQYGLSLGRQSLETAASFLGQLSDRLAVQPKPEEPPKE